jgi:hypothetical protein
MRILAALLVALPLAAAAQTAPPTWETVPAPQAAPPPPAPAAQPTPVTPPPAPVTQPPPPAPAPVAAPSTGPKRDSWYIGFGVGSGGAKAKDETGSYSLSEGMSDATKVSINFKVGMTLTPTLLLGLDINGFQSSGTITGTALDATYTISTFNAMATWFPMERGLFLRGGLGLSNLSLEVTGYGSDDVSGWNLDVGGGYAFWLGKSFNLTLNLDYAAQGYSSSKVGAPTSSSYWALWLGFDWY